MRLPRSLSALLGASCCAFLGACGGGSSTPSTSLAPSSSSALPITLQQSAWPAGALPLGDGLRSLTPTAGELMSCNTSFAKSSSHGGPWIQGSFWYPAQKVAVQGSVSWPAASTSITTASGLTEIVSNNLPTSPVTTGIFPIQTNDPAYQYDTNPNSITAQSIRLGLPASPVVAASPTCLPMGMIGFTTTGVAIFNALDDAGNDAVAHETQDSCQGHPDGFGQYHYHGPSSCMPNVDTSGLVGYALDGFGIYGEKDLTTGRALHDTDLDACHGTTSPVMWQGQLVDMYHYVLTPEYPYTLGCFRGTPVDLTSNQQAQVAAFPG